MNVNVVVLGGRLTRDVDLRFTEGGLAIANIGFACNNRRKKDGEWVDEPVFVDVKIFGKRAEAFAKFHSKGSECMFPHAELRFERWETDAGTRSKLVVIAKDWEFVGSQKQEADDTPF